MPSKKTAPAGATAKYHQQRSQFRSLMLANPNYFGTMKASALPPVLSLQQDTTYEEIGCVGFQPRFNQLEAVVYVYQTSGYGGDVCSEGSTEYVRFYLSYDGGATWEDQGLTSFKAYDIAAEPKLAYDVTLRIKARPKLCRTPVLPRVRAILSWNDPPPAGQPEWKPVWGNVKEEVVQVAPVLSISPFEALTQLTISPGVLEQMSSVIDMQQMVHATKHAPMQAEELHALYQGSGVPEHRYLYPEMHKLMTKPLLSDVPGVAAMVAPGIAGLVDIATILGTILATNGDTSYEELECVGLNPDLGTLVGILRVKRPNGYSGGLCSAGSQEYVTFWLETGGVAGWTYAGTASVNVHDIATAAGEGIMYSVHAPIDLSAHRRLCTEGATTVRVRAILSWQTAAPPSNPNHVPVWGNRVEELIHIPPGPKAQTGDHHPIIETVAHMKVTDIDASGLATGVSIGHGYSGFDSPFGGTVVITGRVQNPPDAFGGAAVGLKYRVWVSSNGGLSWDPVTNSFDISVTDVSPFGITGPYTMKQEVDSEGWYTYREDFTGTQQRFVAENVLAEWETGSNDGLWRIRIDVKDPATNTMFPGSQTIAVQLNNGPAIDPQIAITSGAGSCSDFVVGDSLIGSYSALGGYFGSFNLELLPITSGNFALQPSGTFLFVPGSGRAYTGLSSGVPDSGETGNWRLTTTALPKCGYVIILHTYDRTIQSSSYRGRHTQAPVGFCLRNPTP